MVALPAPRHEAWRAGVLTAPGRPGDAVVASEGWPVARRSADIHVSAECLGKRFRDHAIASRRAALLALGARLPGPVLAERLGFERGGVARWVRAGGGTGAAERVALGAA